jgi:hypothetical protein
MLLCLYAAFRSAPGTDFSNRVSAVILWAAITKLTLFVDQVALDKSVQHGFDAVLFSLLMWQALTLLALYTPAESESTFTRMGEQQGSPAHQGWLTRPITHALFVALLAAASAARATARVLAHGLSAHAALIVEFLGATAGALFALAQLSKPVHNSLLARKVEVTLAGIAGSQAVTVSLPLFKIAHDLAAWTCCFAFAASTILFHAE